MNLESSMGNENEYGLRIYRKLLYFSENGQAIHFTINDTGIFYNGIIIELNKDYLTLVLKEFKFGEMPFLLEEINENSIVKYTTKVEGKIKVIEDGKELC